MFCTKCGAQLPNDANFCLKCGKSQNSASYTSAPSLTQSKWEYKELVIPLNFRAADGLLDPTIYTVRDAEHYNPIVLEYLQREGQNGWEPDGPTDISSMSRVGRIKEKGSFSRYYVSVTIRMKRLMVS
jgi:hypothetical protein